MTPLAALAVRYAPKPPAGLVLARVRDGLPRLPLAWWRRRRLRRVRSARPAPLAERETLGAVSPAAA